jgi:hypothetical protein
MAFLSVIIGITSDLIRTNRMLIEDTLEHTKKMRFGKGELDGEPVVMTVASASRPETGRRPAGGDLSAAGVSAGLTSERN